MPTADTSSAQAVNPFAAQVVQEADSAIKLADVALHEPIRRTLERGRLRARHGRPYVAALIGEEGAGKSHLLWWLRQLHVGSGGLFVSVSALPDLAQPFRHTLKQLVSALCRKNSSEGTGRGSPFERPIDRLLWEALYLQVCDLLDAARIGMYQGPAALLKLVGPLCMEGARRRQLPEFVAAAQPVWHQVEPGLRAFLLSLPTEMSIDPAARAVLVQYPYADRRALCTAWLAGEELGAKDRERIGAKQMINNESAAKYVLCALCRMLTAHPEQEGPLTFIYDQVDVVAQQWGQAGVHSVVEVVTAIQTQGGGVLQVLSCRPATWRLLLEKSPRSATGQTKHIDDTLELPRPSLQELREIVKARGGEGTLLTAQDLDPANWPKEVVTPRALLAHLSALWVARTELQGKEPVPTPAFDAPTAKGMPSRPLRTSPSNTKSLPSRPPGPSASIKNATNPPGPAVSGVPIAVRNLPSKPVAAQVASARNAPSKPIGIAQATTKPSMSPAPEVKKAPEPESAASPSVSWMEMAADEDPSLVQSSVSDKRAPSSLGQKAEPSPVKSAAAPAPKPASMKAKPPEPSAQSPSVTWMEMASEDDPLARALAAIDKKDAEGSGAARPQRTTQDRLRAIAAPSSANLRPEQVLAAFGTRDRMEEWQLAQELGVSQPILAETLAQLEDQGSVRLLPLSDGQRMVARL